MGFKRWIDNWDMLLETDWEGKPAIDDALFRTALLYLCEPETHYADAIDACFYQGYAFRHPSYVFSSSEGFYNTCSRDQVIMSFVAIVLNDGINALPRLRRKFSDKFRQTPDMGWWLRGLKGSKFYSWLFCTVKRIMYPLLFTWNDFWWKVSKKVYWKVRYPYYALHLGSWMLYTLPDSRGKKKLQNIIAQHIWTHDIGNHLLLALNGMKYEVEVNSKDLYYQPKKDFRWQRNINRLPPGVDLGDYNGPFPIDRDIMNVVLKRK